MHCSNAMESTYVLSEIQCTNNFSTYMRTVPFYTVSLSKEAFSFQPQSVSAFICCSNFNLYLKSDFCAHRHALWKIIASHWSMLLLGQQKHWAWFLQRVSHHTYETLAANCQTTFPAVNLLRIQIVKPMCAKWMQKGKPKKEECLKERQT